MKRKVAEKYFSFRRIPKRRKSLKKHQKIQRRAQNFLLRHSAKFREEWKRRMTWLLHEIFARRCSECGDSIPDSWYIPDLCESCFEKIPPYEWKPGEFDRVMERLNQMIQDRCDE